MPCYAMPCRVCSTRKMATLEEDVSPSPQKGKGGALSQLSDTPLRPHALKLDSLSYDTPPKAGPDGTFSPRMWARALAEVYTAGARESIGLQSTLSNHVQLRRIHDAQSMPLGRGAHQLRSIVFEGTANKVEPHVNLMLENLLNHGFLIRKFPATGRATAAADRRLMLSSSPPQILLARPRCSVVDVKLDSYPISDIEQIVLGQTNKLPPTAIFEKCRKYVSKGGGECTLALIGRQDKLGHKWSLSLEVDSSLERDELANALALYIDRCRPHYSLRTEDADQSQTTTGAPTNIM